MSSVKPPKHCKAASGLRVAGLFAGIGGLELGFKQAGHNAQLLVEIDPAANAVLDAHFFGVDRHKDVCTLKSLPAETDAIIAGFPCQDLSQAGNLAGIQGSKSGLVAEVFRLARRGKVPWIVLENVPFMLQLNGGEAMRHIVSELEDMGYAWAYRKVDTRAFGLPQRRERVFLVASKVVRPSGLLFQEEALPILPQSHEGLPCGFYWTEGIRGLGWAIDCLPTLKGGSTIGIPSSPAIWMPDGSIGTPDLRDCERLQGFESDWTLPAESVGRKGYRWKLVGNAVSVPAAEWLGKLILKQPSEKELVVSPMPVKGSWPDFAFGENGKRFQVRSTSWPVALKRTHLVDFLQYPIKPLSHRAATGFYSRLKKGNLRYPMAFSNSLENLIGMDTNLIARPPLQELQRSFELA